MDPNVSPTAVPAPSVPEQKPAKPTRIILIAVIASLVVAGIGIGAYLIYTNKDGAIYKAIFGEEKATESDTEDGNVAEGDGEDEGDDQIDQGDDGANNPYDGWKSYTDTDCNVTFQYPADWNVNAVSGVEFGDVNVSMDNYVWVLTFEPITTGGGFGYMMAEPVPPSSTVNSAVAPNTTGATMVTQYISRSDLISAYDPSIVSTFNIQEDTWEGSVLFIDAAAHELGFGPGEMYTSTPCDWFGISYLYDNQQADYSDLPVKGNATLDLMLSTMDLITNSVTL